MFMTKVQGEEKNKPRFDKEAFKKSFEIFKYIRPHLGYFIAAMVLLILGSLIFMALMGLPGEMANTAIGEPQFDFKISVKDYGWVFLVILILQGIMSYYRTIFFAIVSEKAMSDLRKDLYQKMITQPITFFEEKRVGELTSRITADVEQLQSLFSITLAEFIRQVVILISGIIIIVLWTPDLSLIMLMTFPAIVIVAMVFGKYIRKMSKARQDELANTNTIVEETFQSFSIVKSFANEWYEMLRYSQSVDKVVKISLSFAKIRGIFFIFIITILFGGIFFILWQGAMMVEAGTMEAGDLFSFIIYTGILGGAIASFGTLYTQIISSVGATERILEILATPSEVQLEVHKNKPASTLQLSGNVSYENVSFAYPSRSDVTVLKGIDLNIKAGQKIALVGQSGGGKSTIVQLLMKFYNPNSGQIKVDGCNINEYDLIQFRKNIGIVPQEVILFGGTIKENIAYGKTGATDEEIIKAAQQSNSWEFISTFPEGLNTIVGERGIKLSGGQRQRIAIARAILKDPKILILDEATSSLDAESEKWVQEALDVLMYNRTSIIIAHRLATIREVDCIYVLENGQIIEQGSHQTLIQKENGAYSALARLQFDMQMHS